MARKRRNREFYNELVGRIFHLFRYLTDGEIAEKLGIVRQVVQGWRSGKSRPTLDQLHEIHELTEVDWPWLMNGHSDWNTGIVNAHLPVFVKSNIIQDESAYKAGKHLIGIALHEFADDVICEEYLQISAVFLRYAHDKSVPNPFELAEVEYDEDYCWCSDSHINTYKGIPVPKSYLKEVNKLFDEMKMDYQPSYTAKMTVESPDLTKTVSSLEKSKTKRAPAKAGADESFTKLSSILVEAHGALSDIASQVKKGVLPPDAARQAVEEALDILLKVHGTAEKSGRIRSSS